MEYVRLIHKLSCSQFRTVDIASILQKSMITARSPHLLLK